MPTNDWASNNEATILVAAVEQAKKELREELDKDIKTLAAAIFGVTDAQGQVMKQGMVHTLIGIAHTSAFLCAKLGIAPDEIGKWKPEKKASVITEA